MVVGGCQVLAEESPPRLLLLVSHYLHFYSFGFVCLFRSRSFCQGAMGDEIVSVFFYSPSTHSPTHSLLPVRLVCLTEHRESLIKHFTREELDCALVCADGQDGTDG